MVSRWSGRNPSSTARRRKKLWIRSVAEATSISARANSPTTSRSPARRVEGDVHCLLPARFLLVSKAGHMLASKAMKTVMPAVNEITAQSIRASANRGMSVGPNALTAAAPLDASTSPSNPPQVESTSVSVRTWKAICSRPAPRARRTANSRWRTVPRASSRPATFDARDQQHHENGSKQKPQGKAKPGGSMDVQWHDSDTRRHLISRIHGFQPACNSVHFILRARPGYAVPDPAQHEPQGIRPGTRAVAGPVRMGSDRLPYFGIRKREMKIRRHDAYDEIASIVHDEARSQCFPRSCELLLPQLVTQHGHPLAAFLFFGGKDAAEQGLHAKQRPKVRRHAGRTHSFRRPVGPKQKCLPDKGGQVFKTAVLASPILEIEKRDAAFMKLARRIAGKHHG